MSDANEMIDKTKEFSPRMASLPEIVGALNVIAYELVKLNKNIEKLAKRTGSDII